MDNRPNIVLIMTDEMRGDCMGFAGHPDIQTPYLDTLFSHGVSFQNAYSSCPSCVPARAILHTGMTQRHTGRVSYQDRVPWRYPVTMAGELKKAGYYTQCVGKMHVHPLRNLVGFDHIELHDGYLHNYRAPHIPGYEQQYLADDYFYYMKNELGMDCDIIDTGIDCNGWTTRTWPYEEKYHPTNWAVTRSIDFLRRRDRDKPFFLNLSFVRPHAPYDAPKFFYDMYKDKDLRKPLSGDWDDKKALDKYGKVFNGMTGPQDERMIHDEQAGYYACISHIDQQIGRFMMALIEQQLMDNTVIIFTSDHGEMLSDHALIRKSTPYEGSAHIPMIVSGPEKYVGKHQRTEDTLVELMDVMPTVLDLAGAKAPSHLDGQSLLHHTDREFIHGEHLLEWENMSSQFIVTKKDKYIWFSITGKEQYFDLEKDPTESHNAILDEDKQERIAYLRQKLVEQLKDSEEGYVQNGVLKAGIFGQPILPKALEKAEKM